MAATIPLEGLYFHLVRNGFRLSVRDYQDAVVALRRGYGSPRREDLQWLCQALWARSEHEVSRLDRIFRDFHWPSDEDLHDLTNLPVSRPETRSRRKQRSSGKRTPRPGREAPVFELAGPSESGVGLPSATAPERPHEVFIFSPRPLVDLRSLIVAWRRFRIAQRSGPRIELDIDATVAAQSRHRFLLEPVLLPARRNQARLVALVDASESMAAWRRMNRLIAESLERSQLAHTALYYFDDAPDEELYELETVSRPLALESAVQAHPGCCLVVVSDAGAARGRLDRERVQQVRAFVKRVHRTWHPIAWLNPMPRQRWQGTTAEAIASLSGISMFQFTEDSLIQAVDFLRGKRD